MKKYCGLDCGKGSVHCCALDALPPDLARFSAKHSPEILGANRKDLIRLLELAEIYAIEPTGAYSRIFIDWLRKNGKTVFLVPDRRIAAFRTLHGLDNKQDGPDSVAICGYLIEKHGVPNAFINFSQSELRDAYNALESMKTARGRTQNQLGLRLCYECPEWIAVYEESKRKWLSDKIPALWRFIAGEKVYNAKTREADLLKTCGCGISEDSRELARQLIYFSGQELMLEKRLSHALEAPEYSKYHAVFDDFGFGPWTRAGLLVVAYPMNRFLYNGKEDIYYKRGRLTERPSGMTKRNLSQARFKVYCGLGKVEVKSGKSQGKEIDGGNPRLRSHWYQHITVVALLNKPKGFTDKVLKPLMDEHGSEQPWLNPKIVARVSETLKITEVMASTMVHYECLGHHLEIPGRQPKRYKWQKCMAVAGRLCNLLYKRLIKIGFEEIK